MPIFFLQNESIRIANRIALVLTSRCTVFVPFRDYA